MTVAETPTYLPLADPIVIDGCGHKHCRQEFRFEGSEVYIWRDERSGTVVLSQQRPVTWDDFLQLRAELADDDLRRFMSDRAQPPAQRRSPFEDG